MKNITGFTVTTYPFIGSSSSENLQRLLNSSRGSSTRLCGTPEVQITIDDGRTKPVFAGSGGPGSPKQSCCT
ncbi:unnamed protein product [Nesidiocoris tenuis]|uniref:Uncharacterized protein n=1 Tax=Nesidiocoris tenuis TaxID=355587 RepID=A0A6H5HNB9_9HEMI|nr:unnamed protein product [Nesidiocoris tenuis]CAB0018948.1 unnamed protein product [Nesidiocoris tenuis]